MAKLKRRSAKQRLRSRLADIGLASLTDWWYKRKTDGWSDAEIWVAARETKVYKSRFPGLDTLREAGRGVGEREWLDYERTATAMFRAAGLPSGFYDQPSDFAKFISAEVSVTELQDRVKIASSAALSQPPDVRDQLRRLYGIAEGDITAYFLDPKRAVPVLQERFSATLSATAARRSGFGDLSLGEAESLARFGVGEDEAAEGFGTLVEAREVFDPLDQGETAISREQQLGATFRGDTLAQQAIRRQARRRVARFEQGGGYAADREGFSGLGSAST